MQSFIESLAPETRLIVYCSRTRMRAELAEKIRALVARGLEWDLVLSCADQNAVLPLLDRQLHAVAADLVPAAQTRRLNEAVRANTFCCLGLTAALIEIQRLFHAEGIMALPYKGPVIAAQAYGDVSLRQFNDLDIILKQKDMPKAHDVMLGLGYRAKFPALISADLEAALVPGEYRYHSEARAAVVELHTELTLRHFPVVPNLDEFASRGIEVNLGGNYVETFSPEDAFIALCMHGSKDFWARLTWVADVAELIESHPQLDWRQAGARAKALRLDRMVHVGLTLAAMIFDTALPNEVTANMKEDREAGEIALELARSLLRPEPRALSARARFEVRRRLVPGFLAGWRYAARLTMAPAEEDWRMLRLPRALAPLYIVLRPFRLMRKYGRAREAA